MTRSIVTMRGTAVAALGVACMLAAWGAGAQDGGRGDLMHGEQVYTQWCAACHAAGPNMPGTQALEAKYNGATAAVLVERADLPPELVKVIVRSGVSVMPPFRKTEISDADLEALADYIVTTARSHGAAQ